MDCWNKINETHDSKWRYALSWDKDLCEECGQYKRVIVVERFGHGRKEYWQKQSRIFKIKEKNKIIREVDDFDSI